MLRKLLPLLVAPLVVSFPLQRLLHQHPLALLRLVQHPPKLALRPLALKLRQPKLLRQDALAQPQPRKPLLVALLRLALKLAPLARLLCSRPQRKTSTTPTRETVPGQGMKRKTRSLNR